jgi:hypothetical protein
VRHKLEKFFSSILSYDRRTGRLILFTENLLGWLEADVRFSKRRRKQSWTVILEC